MTVAADQKVRIVNRAWPGRWAFQRQDEHGRQVYTDDLRHSVLFMADVAVHLRDKFRNLGNSQVFVEDLEGKPPPVAIHWAE